MFGFFTRLFRRRQNAVAEDPAMKKFLVVGLGNIGPEYSDTRHNVGFQVLDTLAAKRDFQFSPVKLGDLASYNLKGRKIFCLKPSTYMNRSGKAVLYWMNKENINPDRLLIITDDINLNYGVFRLKTKGSDGGHNGLKDIQQTLGSGNYSRFRFGIGSDFSRGRQVDYVLGKWEEEEKKDLPKLLSKAGELVESFVLAGAKNTMNDFNGDQLSECAEGIDP